MDVELQAPGPTGASEATALARWTDRRKQGLTWLLAATMAAVAGWIALPGILVQPAAATPDLGWLLLVPMFALAEVVVIYIPTQRHAHGYTLRELPAVLGLVFLAPQQYVTAFVVGTVLALVIQARMWGLKLAFNAAMFALEAALGALIYHAILLGGDPLSVTGWAAAIVAVLATDLVSTAAVTAAISLAEGAFDSEVLHEALVPMSAAAFINTCVALLVATLTLVQPTALPLLGVVIVLLSLGYRAYLSLARGHAQTQLLYRFVDRTSAATSSDELVRVVLNEAAALMHAERAYLLQVSGQEDVRCYSAVERALHMERFPPAVLASGAWWAGALADGGVLRHGAKGTRGETQRGADERPPDATPIATARDGLAVRLGSAGRVRYVLVVCDRSFEKETFSAEDGQAFEALAAHAGVAIGRARSLGDLEALAEKLEVARDAALAASEAKSTFLANISHEIRTPLTTVLATAEILQDTDLSDLQVNLLERLQRCGGELQELVEAILDFSRLDSGQLQLAVEPFDVRALAAQIGDDYQAKAGRVGHRFHCEVAPDVPHTVLGDRARLQELLSHLLDNAVKFTHEGRIDLVVRRSSTAEESLVFEVRDTGIGIDVADQASVFGVFSQVDGTTTRHYEGTGLGLAICVKLIDLMGGAITVDSEKGVGSTFTLRLPLSEPTPGSGEGAPVGGEVRTAVSRPPHAADMP